MTEISAPPARPGQEIHFGPGPAPAGAVHVTTPTRAALLSDLGACLQAGRGFALATLNLDHAVKLRADPAFRAAYLAQTHVVADGNPIVSAFVSPVVPHNVAASPSTRAAARASSSG